MLNALVNSSDKFGVFNKICIFYNSVAKFRFDSLGQLSSFTLQMDNLAYQKLLNKFHIGLGVVLTLGFFVFMSFMLRPFTFSTDPLIAQLQACIAAVPISTTFWFAYHMFMIVLVDQRNQKKKVSKN
jgi:hypothetical protein